ncbi:class I SAM-dependent methyltransferase [Nocardioides sp. zg-1230]|uniref:class I SAM-dependent methyltransferase n=1 Tax=Nocardioides sp. zg-1230 TaxID=2736601 RepID=UPI0015552005|nr:class I SAM-dependent methyltransferase [Nocardioides sp. zg-1230]
MRETIEAYDRDAEAYAARTVAMPDSVRADMEDLATRLGPGARVLEIGSGGGREALLMEELGLAVRRTDVTPGFVDLLRGQGHACDLLDPLVDDLVPPDGPPGVPYDAVWANASLLHVDRRDLPTVLSRLADVTRPGGLLRASFKEGDGEGWSTHGTISAPRHFTYWRAPDLEVVTAGSGWSDVVVRRGLEGDRGETWLGLSAVRDEVSA